MNHTRRILAGVLLVVVALILSGTAFAKEVMQVTVTGPGLTSALVLTDADRLTMFQDLAFDGNVPREPADLGAAYFEVQLAIGDGTQVGATVVYHYYPGINSDHGYMYYADMIDDSSPSEGQWFQLSDVTDHALRSILRIGGVRFGVSTAGCVVTEQAPGA